MANPCNLQISPTLLQLKSESCLSWKWHKTKEWCQDVSLPSATQHCQTLGTNITAFLPTELKCQFGSRRLQICPWFNAVQLKFPRKFASSRATGLPPNSSGGLYFSEISQMVAPPKSLSQGIVCDLTDF